MSQYRQVEDEDVNDDDGTAPSHMLQGDDDHTDNKSDDEDKSEGSETECSLPRLVKGSAEGLKFHRGTKVVFKIRINMGFNNFSPDANEFH